METKIDYMNFPALKKSSGVKINSSSGKKEIKAFDINSGLKKNEIKKTLEKKSINDEIKNQQKLHEGLDLVLVGDLTGSMSSYHSVLKNKFTEICSTLFQIIPNLKIGIIFYLDHGSGDEYITSVKKLTTNVEELNEFINSTRDGSGGDADEAVEDALHDLCQMNWSPYSKRSVVLFGDARPHEVSCCPYQYDYFNLTKELYEKNVVVNSVYCSSGTSEISKVYEVDIGDFSKRISRPSDAQFFAWISNVTGGVGIGAERIDDIIDIIKGIAAKDAGKFEELEMELKKLSVKPIPALEQIKKRSMEIECKKLYIEAK